MAVVRKNLQKQGQDPHYIPVPRRTLWRRFWRFFLRTMALLLIRADVRGRRNFPKEGPVIIVANHNAIIEVGMITAFAPYPVEFLTTGDIPLEPRVAWIANLYGYIPVKRGSMDRKAMQRALSVLEQGGVIALFPQGGIWDTQVTQARTGVAWLSQKGNATVVPIGFGGTEGALMQALHFQQPHITMNVGAPLDPTPNKVEGKSRKEVLEDSTGEIMQAVFDLIPEWEKDRWAKLAEENFELQLELVSAKGRSANGSTPQIANAQAVSKFFHRPVLLDAMRRNLDLPVAPLEHLPTERNPQAFADALDVVLRYIQDENPYFLTYRFGNDEGHAMETGLEELRDAAQWAAHNGYNMSIKPVRRFRMEGDADYTIHEYPQGAQEI
jgi:1-acyl-sn-glycerol-3-phosphate acyltransferase